MVKYKNLFSYKENRVIENSQDSTIIGYVSCVFYILLIAYIYISGMNRLQLNTFSTSFQNCEKIGSTIFLFIFLGLLQGLFAAQGFYKKDIINIIILVLNYIIILCWVLFMFVFPYTKDGNISKTHSLIAAFVILIMTINCWLTYDRYSQYYKDLDNLFSINVVLTLLAGLAGFFMITHGIFKTSIKYVAFFELITLLIFVLFLVFFTQLPVIPSEELKCVF